MEETFGQRIRRLREQHGLSQYDVAERILGKRERAGEISRWESGKNEPSHDNLRKIAVIYSCSIDELLGVATSIFLGEQASV